MKTNWLAVVIILVRQFNWKWKQLCFPDVKNRGKKKGKKKGEKGERDPSREERHRNIPLNKIVYFEPLLN